MKRSRADRVIIDGKAVDACLHIPMLDNPEANRLADERAIEISVNEGMSREKAQRLYAIPFDIRTITEP